MTIDKNEWFPLVGLAAVRVSSDGRESGGARGGSLIRLSSDRSPLPVSSSKSQKLQLELAKRNAWDASRAKYELNEEEKKV